MNKWSRNLAFALLMCAAIYARTAPATAFNFSCAERAENCMSKCGTTVSYQYQYSICAGYDDPPQQWTCIDRRAVYEYSWSSGIESFECDEVGQHSSCMCAY